MKIENIVEPIDKESTSKVEQKPKADKPKVDKPKADKPKAEVPKKQALKKIGLPKVSLNDLVEVQSCVYGELIYVSKQTGNRILWDDFGSSNPMTIQELLDMRNAQRKFFEAVWITLVGDNAQSVIDYLQVGRFYNKISSIDDFDEIFNYDPADIPSIVGNMSASMKEIIARRAYALVQDGALDSRRMIDAIESATGFEIME